MRRMVLIARVLLGLGFVVFGLNWFFHFFPVPKPGAELRDFIGALKDTGYVMQLVKGTEALAGLMILSGRFLPLGLTILAPISINIFCAHLFLDPTGLPMAVLVIILQLFLAWAYRGSFSGILSARSQPSG